MLESETSLSAFFDGWELFQYPALAGTVAGTILGLLGVYVVLRRLVFLSAAVSQAAGFGVALSFYAHMHLAVPEAWFPPMLAAALATGLAVLPAIFDKEGAGVRRDSLLGIAYLLGAAGTLAVGTRIVQELHDIDTLLLGSAVAVLPGDFAQIVGTSGLLLALHIWWWRGFSAVSFDPAGARVRGLPVRVIDTALFVSLALAISVSTRVLGALPTFAFSVLPAIAATRLSPNVPRALAIAAILGGLSGFVGYVAAFRFALPVGPAQTLVALGFVVLAELLRLILRPLRSR